MNSVLNKEIQCPICLGTFKNVQQTECNHYFCKQCILDWLKTTETCPSCNAPCKKRNLRPSPRVDALLKNVRRLAEAVQLALGDGALPSPFISSQSQVEMGRGSLSSRRSSRGGRADSGRVLQSVLGSPEHQEDCDSVQQQIEFSPPHEMESGSCPADLRKRKSTATSATAVSDEDSDLPELNITRNMRPRTVEPAEQAEDAESTITFNSEAPMEGVVEGRIHNGERVTAHDIDTDTTTAVTGEHPAKDTNSMKSSPVDLEGVAATEPAVLAEDTVATKSEGSASSPKKPMANLEPSQLGPLTPSRKGSPQSHQKVEILPISVANQGSTNSNQNTDSIETATVSDFGIGESPDKFGPGLTATTPVRMHLSAAETPQSVTAGESFETQNSTRDDSTLELEAEIERVKQQLEEAQKAEAANTVVGAADKSPSPVSTITNRTSPQVSPMAALPAAIAEVPETSSHAVVLLTGIDRSTESKIIKPFRRLLRESGGRMVREYEQAVTHVVGNTDDENFAVKRTLKFMQGVADGKWVVSKEWIKACVDAKRIISADKFEVTGFVTYDDDADCDVKKAGGPARSRAAHATDANKLLFTGWAFYLWQGSTSDSVPPDQSEVRALIKSTGAEVLRKPPVSTSSSNTYILIDTEIEWRDLPTPGPHVLYLDFLYDSVVNYTRKDAAAELWSPNDDEDDDDMGTPEMF